MSQDCLGIVKLRHRNVKSAHLGNIALRTVRRLSWDAKNSKFINDDEANKFLVPECRAPWALPKI